MCDGERAALCEGTRRQAAALSYLFAEVDAAQTRVQLADQIFFRLAAQVDWESLGRGVLTDLCKRNNFEPPGPSHGHFIRRWPRATQLSPMRS